MEVGGTNPLLNSSQIEYVQTGKSLPEGYRPPTPTVRVNGDFSGAAAKIALSYAGSPPQNSRTFNGEGQKSRIVVGMPQAMAEGWSQEY
jgi:hypothetical protein